MPICWQFFSTCTMLVPSGLKGEFHSGESGLHSGILRKELKYQGHHLSQCPVTHSFQLDTGLTFFLMWIICKVFIEFYYNNASCFMIWLFGYKTFGILVFWPGMRNIGRWSLNHWTTTEVPWSEFFLSFFFLMWDLCLLDFDNKWKWKSLQSSPTLCDSTRAIQSMWNSLKQEHWNG